MLVRPEPGGLPPQIYRITEHECYTKSDGGSSRRALSRMVGAVDGYPCLRYISEYQIACWRNRSSFQPTHFSPVPPSYNCQSALLITTLSSSELFVMLSLAALALQLTRGTVESPAQCTILPLKLCYSLA